MLGVEGIKGTYIGDLFPQHIKKIGSIKKAATEIRAIAEECSINSEWVENDELSRLLSLSKHQLKGYRGRGLLGYTMIGNKIYYKRREVERFINRHINK